MAAAQAQLILSFAPDISYAAEDFIAGNANEDALALVDAWPNWPYSVVLLYGEKGCGKTHLAHVFARQSKATFLDAAQIGRAPADQLLTGNHCWVLEDIETVKEAASFAQLLNHVRARGDYLLLTAQSAPARQTFELPDLRSRLMALPAVEMKMPDDALLKAVLAKAFADRQLRLPSDVLEYAVTRLERSYEAAQAFADRLDRAALSSKSAVSLPLARRLLAMNGV